MKALIALALVVTSAPLVAAAAEDGAAQPAERKICRRIPGAPSSDSRLGNQRVCLTAAQWRARSDASVDDAMSTMSPLAQDGINSPAEGYTPAASRAGAPVSGPNR